MILCAGLGSRLNPLTNVVPKPFVPVGGKPIISHIIDRLKEADVSDIIINTQYLHDYFLEHLNIHNNFDLNIEVLREEELSGDAGGLKKAQHFFGNDDFFVLSGDDLTNINLKKLKEFHYKNNSLLSLPVVEVNDPTRYGIVEIKDNEVVSFYEKPKYNEAKSNLANTSIYFCNNEIFDLIPSNKFYGFGSNLIPKILDLKYKISAYSTDEYCKDIGTLISYKDANFDILKGIHNIRVPEDFILEGNNLSHKSLVNDGFLNGKNIIGKNVVIGKNSRIENCIFWDNVKISDNCSLKNCILGYNVSIPEDSYVFDAVYTKL